MRHISIIIPAHNEEKYLRQTLESVRLLNPHPFEVIIVDNTSTDTTLQIANDFKKTIHDSNINFNVQVLQEKRKGVQFARNAGYIAARGSIIAFLDADCLPPSDWLIRLDRAFSEGAIAVSGPYNHYDYREQGFLFSLLFSVIVEIPQHYFYPIINRIFQALHISGILIFGNCACTREALVAAGGINTHIAFYGDDADLVRRLRPLGKIIFDKNCFVKSSARRYVRQGILRTFWLYALYFCRENFLRKPEHPTKSAAETVSNHYASGSH